MMSKTRLVGFVAAATLLLSGLLSGALSGTAAAQSARPTPTGKAALTKNPIYKTGEFDFQDCKEMNRQPNDVDTYRIYLDSLLTCLNQSWAYEFEQAGLKFVKPKVRYITKSVRTGCGKYPADYAAGLYCELDKTMWIMISKYQLADPSEFFLFEVIAHEYAHSVQARIGILTAVDKLAKPGSAAWWGLIRRVELQAECMSGAFIGSVWASLGRDKFDWDDMLRSVSGDKAHGKTKNIVYWLKRGWNGNGPKVCNTFSAPASRVA